MCGRFTQAARPADMAKAFPFVGAAPERPARYNLAPTDPVLALTEEDWRELRFGLVPFWAKSPKDVGARFLNARLESAVDNKVFAESYAKRRCLIPTTGFYEWHNKRPFFITRPEEPVFALAGLWAGWGKGEERVYSCAILTRPAEGGLERIHDRMPLVVPPELRQEWLRAALPPERLLELKVPLEAREVSTYVNSVKHEGPECLGPAAE